MLRKRERELLDVFGRALARHRVDRVLHRVGREDGGVVPRDVRRFEIPLEAHGDRQVLEVVLLAAARHAHEPDSRLTVAVGTERQDQLPRYVE